MNNRSLISLIVSIRYHAWSMHCDTLNGHIDSTLSHHSNLEKALYALSEVLG